MNDSPLKLAHIEEYRKQKAHAEVAFTINTNISMFCRDWLITLRGETPRGIYEGSELINPDKAFLKWRIRSAKRRLLRQWRIICEMES